MQRICSNSTMLSHLHAARQELLRAYAKEFMASDIIEACLKFEPPAQASPAIAYSATRALAELENRAPRNEDQPIFIVTLVMKYHPSFKHSSFNKVLTGVFLFSVMS